MMKMKAKSVAVIAAVMMSGALGVHTGWAAPAVIQGSIGIIQTDAQSLSAGHVAIPMSDMAKAVGAQLKWQPATNTLVLSQWDRTYTFKVGSRVYHDGTSTSPSPKLLEPVRMIGGHAYVEASFLRTLGYEVRYQDGILTLTSPLGQKTRQILNQGDLSSARQTAMSIANNGQLLRYAHPKLETTAGETSDLIFLFPQGEALRFYMMYGNTVSFIQFDGDVPVVKAQAHVQEGEGSFVQLLGGRAAQMQGKFPKINKPFLAYASHIFGDSTSISSGRVEPDGTYVSLGSEFSFGGQVDQSTGRIVYVMDGEKRTDRR